tara:strand:- start:51 stop:584 length:534 start_codon:yes stop_codon:yes gene_type:complete
MIVNRIIFIFDMSGSMHPNRENMIEKYNDFLIKQKKENGDKLLLTIFFNNNVQICNNILIKDAKLLTDNDYIPFGTTRLYDAIGKSFEMCQRDKNNICVILTDGQENCSEKWTQHQIFNKIIYLKEKKDWVFYFYGCDPNTYEIGFKMGIYNTHRVKPLSMNLKKVYEDLTDFFNKN